MCPMRCSAYNRCTGCIRRGPATLARLRDHRRRRRLRPGRCPTEPQSTGAVAADPRPRGRAGGSALRPHRASCPAHGGGRRPPAASPRTADGRRFTWRAGAGPQRREGRCAPAGRHTASDGDSARRFPSGLSARHPGVEVHLVEDGGVRLVTRLERGDVHLALTAASDAQFRGARCPLFASSPCSRSQRLGLGATLEIGDLVDASLLLTRRDFASREWFEAASQVAHMRPRVAPGELRLHARRAGPGRVRRRNRPSNVGFRARSAGRTPRAARGPVGRWLTVAWDPRRFLATYAVRFVEAWCARPALHCEIWLHSARTALAPAEGVGIDHLAAGGRPSQALAGSKSR